MFAYQINLKKKKMKKQTKVILKKVLHFILYLLRIVIDPTDNSDIPENKKAEPNERNL